MTNTIKLLNAGWDDFEKERAELEAEIKMLITKKATAGHWSGLTPEEYRIKTLSNINQIFNELQEHAEPKPENKPQKEISIQGHSFGVYPSLHFVKLIYATN